MRYSQLNERFSYLRETDFDKKVKIKKSKESNNQRITPSQRAELFDKIFHKGQKIKDVIFNKNIKL